MTIGAVDYIDRLLVEKYATEKVDNHNSTESQVKPEVVLNAMQNFSDYSRNVIFLQNQLKSACAGVNAMNRQYICA